MKQMSENEERKRYCLEKAIKATKFEYDEDISARGLPKKIIKTAEKFEEYLKEEYLKK